ncbi:Maf family protein [Aliikangiella sp. G2MR2-5]|uniref:Maf family protein n=1 Tax=Aliikangiella sp. G2MR2-5 TaxID=2788943 RepID=UPI001AEECF89
MFVLPGSISVILASQSPRRRELLAQIGIAYELCHVDIDESVIPGEPPLTYVKRMAESKAEAAWDSEQYRQIEDYSSKPIISADTCIEWQGQILGKPENEADAVRMLTSLSGETHKVHSAVAIKSGNYSDTAISTSRVTFALLSEDEIRHYCETAEGVDKAGAYAIQGAAAQFVSELAGSYSGVVGLPLYETSILVKNFLERAQ